MQGIRYANDFAKRGVSLQAKEEVQMLYLESRRVTGYGKKSVVPWHLLEVSRPRHLK